jgi:hypothetical protein
LLTPEQIEIAIFFISQTAIAIWGISGMKSDLRNLTEAVSQLEKQSSDTRDRVLRIEGRLHIDPET